MSQIFVRTCLAVLHFNENSCRKQATTLSAEERWKLKVPKGRGGAIVACPVKEDATFRECAHWRHKLVHLRKSQVFNMNGAFSAGYVDVLFQETLERCCALPSFKTALADATPLTTQPMTSSTYPRQPRVAIIEAHKSRFIPSEHPAD